MIAFSTDANVAARGVYLLSFLPESDVERIVGYAARAGQAFVRGADAGQCLWHGGGGGVPAGSSARRGGRVVALERYPLDPQPDAGGGAAVAQAASRADAIFIPDGADRSRPWCRRLTRSGVDPKRMQLLGTGLWDDPRIFADPALEGGWYAAPDPTGFRNFSGRYRTRYGQDPVRTATLAYDAVALVAALVKTQGRAALHRARC